MLKNSVVKSKEILKSLTLTNGAPGFEKPVARKVEELLDGIGTISYDKLGSIIVEKNGGFDNPRIMLAAHMDEVAFMVKGITEAGLIKFVALGGWWPHVLPAQKVVVQGNKGPITGVIGALPPHYLSPADREKVMPIKNMVIDIGAFDAKNVQELGIEVGQPILPFGEWTEMANPEIICTKALDDRVGVALMVQIMKNLKKHPNTVIAAGTAQEEVGVRGAKTAVNLVNPDVAIILEGPPADDFPGTAEFVQGAMRKGPQIRAYDPTAIANPGLFNFIKTRATALKIPFQVTVRDSGGTDAAVIHVHSHGVPSIVIGVPVRYAHTHIGLMSMKDFEHTTQLVVDIIMNLDQKTVKSFLEPVRK